MDMNICSVIGNCTYTYVNKGKLKTRNWVPWGLSKLDIIDFWSVVL